MTAHPESVVGRLRAAKAAIDNAPRTLPSDESGQDVEYAWPWIAHEHAPALLAALEKVWERVQDAKTWSPGCDAHYHVAAEIESDLAPLFTQPETPDAQ